jgi:hypothetical protein
MLATGVGAYRRSARGAAQLITAHDIRLAVSGEH